jgi:hypothetical protein
MVRPAILSGIAGPNTLENRTLERKPASTQCAGRAFASAARSGSPTPPVPDANSL